MSQEQVANYVVLTIVVGALVIGLISMLVGRIVALFDWARDQMAQAVDRERANMSSKQAGYVDQKSNEEPAISPATTTPATSNNALQSGATNSNELLVGQARALAVLVKAGKIGETEGIKMVFGVSPSSTNPRYQAARTALKAELDKLNNPFPHRTPEQKNARDALGLNR